ncbi:substrate-binding periplasmic protein [Paludibacterium purpuratum]|uniref:Amino acid ABC transporter substrate-binding protein (PAAT family) n=1 Tax=Paludibacterium purpuratum TaxID=1144873 RepID=A0A4R7B3L1_9NEIS|nr:transporter substrate-binding domain-containing protein [Paludibacterium purpuratum]TDR76610.1 amino acid ABC transporter substrate-binding protein (PAAT family) [Paludibacterium purpuratum]
MSEHSWRLCLLLLLCWLPSAARAVDARCDKVVISADPAYPPLHWYDGNTLQGASIAIATRVLSDLHVPYEVRYVGPLKRVLGLAQSGQVDVVATLKMTPERQAFLRYGSTPALNNPVAVFVTRQGRFHYTDWQDLIGKRGAVAAGNQFGDGFDDYLRGRLTVSVVPDLTRLFLLLQYQHADYAVTGLYPGMAWLAAKGDENRYVALHPFVVNTQNYVTFSRASPCATLLPAFDQRLRTLIHAHAFDHIVEDYMAMWRQHPVLGK